MQKQRLRTLEKQIARLPRNGAELLRIAKSLEGEAGTHWLTTLSDAELEAYGQALNEETWAAGGPVYDLTALTDAELERVSEGDQALLSKCPIIQPPQHWAAL